MGFGVRGFIMTPYFSENYAGVSIGSFSGISDFSAVYCRLVLAQFYFEISAGDCGFFV